MSLQQIAARLEERERALARPLSPEEATGYWEEGVRLRAALLEARAQLCHQWMALSQEASWTKTLDVKDVAARARLLGSG